MGKRQLSDLFIYKWRFIIGYVVVILSLLVILAFVGLYSPGGLSQAEIDSVIGSSSVSFSNFNSLEIINLPYHLLQHLFLEMFGVTIISVKLASLTLAMLSAIGMMILLKRWFTRNIGIFSTLIAITTSQFLFIAQDGTANIMYLFLPVWLMVLASLIARRGKYKDILKICFFILSAISLYTPLSVYAILALTSAVALHPHLRYIAKQLSLKVYITGIIISIFILTPLIVSVISDFSVALNLLGIPTSMPNFEDNIRLLGSQYFGFASPALSTILTPFFGLGSMLIILIGLLDIAIKRATAKSYIILAWIICLIPVILINPNYISLSYLPFVLLLASGLSALLGYWYRLFPRNPYARITGLIPIAVLVLALVLSGIEHNINGYRYDPDIANQYSIDLKILPYDSTSYILVADNEKPFYGIISEYNGKVSIITSPGGDSFVATNLANKEFTGYKITKIITNSKSQNSNRYYLYQKINK